MASAYWESRIAAKQAALDRMSDSATRAAAQAYDRAIRQLNNDIERVLGTFSRRTGLTSQEVVEYLNGPAGAFSNALQARISTLSDGAKSVLGRSDAYKARITRMQAIQEDMRIS